MLLTILPVRSTLSAGESWALGVQKMLAVHETDGELGVIYLDLFPRSGLLPCRLVPPLFCCTSLSIFGEVMQKSCAIALFSYKHVSLVPSCISVSILKGFCCTEQGQCIHPPAHAQLQGQTSLSKSAQYGAYKVVCPPGCTLKTSCLSRKMFCAA